MNQLPRGRVTLLFTDIEGSTGLVRSLGPEYPFALGRHRDVLREAVERHEGVVLDTLGDETSNVFADAQRAVTAAVEAQTRSWRTVFASGWASIRASRRSPAAATTASTSIEPPGSRRPGTGVRSSPPA